MRPGEEVAGRRASTLTQRVGTPIAASFGMDGFLTALSQPFFSLVDLILDLPSRRAEESWSSVNGRPVKPRGEAALVVVGDDRDMLAG